MDGREVGALHGLLGWTDQKLEIYVDGALDTSLYTDCSDGRIKSRPGENVNRLGREFVRDFPHSNK